VITIRVKIRNNYDDKYWLSVSLPAAPMELYDMLDRIGADNHYCNVYMNIDDDRIPKVMQDGGFYDDIFRMNMLAQRLEEMPPADTAGFTAVLYDHEEYNLTDLLLVTYGLDAYPIYSCKNYAELGEIVIDNNMIVLDALTLDEYKTKTVVEMLKALGVEGKALIVTAEADAKVIKSAANIPGVKTAAVNTLNVYDILNYDKFIVVKNAVGKIEEVYA